MSKWGPFDWGIFFFFVLIFYGGVVSINRGDVYSDGCSLRVKDAATDGGAK